MDYTRSDAFVIHSPSGNRMHQSDQPVTTEVSAQDMNKVLWSLMEVVKLAGLTGVDFDPDDPATYQVLRDSLSFLQVGTGAARRTLQAKGRDFLDMDDFYSVLTSPGSEAADSAALERAINQAYPLGIPVMLPARPVYVDGRNWAQNRVRVWGRGASDYNSDLTGIVGGSALIGHIVTTSVEVELMNLGVRSPGGVDGVKCTAPYGTGRRVHIENVTVLCNDPTDAIHALLLESHLKATVRNARTSKGKFGIVVKCQDADISNVHMRNHGDTGLYLKSDDTSGVCGKVRVRGVRVDTATLAGMRCQADSATLENAQISQVHISDVQRGVLLELLDKPGAILNSINLSGFTVERSSIADVSIINSRSGTSIEDITISGLRSKNPTGKVIETSCAGGTSIRNLTLKGIRATYAPGTLQAVLDSAVFLDGGVLATYIDDVSIDNGTDLGALNYQTSSNAKLHILGAHRCNVLGGGRPLDGNLNQDLSATANQIIKVAEPMSGGLQSFSRVSNLAGANINVDRFQPEVTGRIFQPGHQHHVFNNSATYTMTVEHDVAKGINNLTNANVVIPVGGIFTWTWTGDTWVR